MSKIEVTICLGSSCFSRKKRDIVSALQDYIDQKNLSNRINLKGGHCLGKCSVGPIIVVNEQIYTGITPAKAIRIIEKYLSTQNN